MTNALWMLSERRNRRSADREVALRYQMEHVREQGNLEALVLSDADGLVLASAGDSSVCEELGAEDGGTLGLNDAGCAGCLDFWVISNAFMLMFRCRQNA